MTRVESFVLRQFARRRHGERVAAYDGTPFLRQRLLDMVGAGLLQVERAHFVITDKGRRALRSH